MTGIPFMLTQAQKEALRAQGLTNDEIAQLTPEQAHKRLNGDGEPLVEPDRDSRPERERITALRLQLRRAGFHPISLTGKIPAMKRWQQKFDVSEEEICR